MGEADANHHRRRAAKGRAKEEREERAELAPFGEDYGSGGQIVQRSTCSMTTAPEEAVCTVSFVVPVPHPVSCERVLL